MTPTVVKLGYSNPLTDAFGAHPLLGSVLDLNDGATYTLTFPDGLEIPPPPHTLVTAGNIRTQGERATRAIYRHNREVRCGLILGPMQTHNDLTLAIRLLLSWLNGPPTIPFSIQYQAPGASSPVYLDVVGAAHSIPADESGWLRLQLEPVELIFVCRPGLRGDRLWLQNLAVNPGFEAPSGPGVTVFNDAFANVSAYVVQAGGAPTVSPANTYVDIMLANAASLIRYYRLGEGSGSNAADIGGAAQTGTYVGSPTLGVAGAISGDTDTAVTFNGTSQYVVVPATGLPIGNSAISLGAWFKFGSNPAGQQEIISYGQSGAHNFIQIDLTTGGAAQADVGGTNVTSGALSTGVWHFAVVTWDGTTLRLYVDGATVGTPATPGAQTVPASSNKASIGANVANSISQFFGGQIDKAFYVAGTLTSGQITNIYNAGHSGATGTLSSAMSVPNGSRLSFGSPNWSAINQWQIRFRYVTGLSTTWYLHYTDANDYLAATLSGTTLALVQVIAGVSNTLATVSLTPTLAHEGWYWLQITQYPTVPTDPACVQAVLLSDNEGSIGAQVALCGPIGTTDTVTALSGQPQIQASGAALVIGGAFSGVHSVSLFGPGGWWLANAAVNGQSLGAWEQTVGNCYAGGPVQSYGAARLDLAPSGTISAYWLNANVSSVASLIASGAYPASSGVGLTASAWVKSSGLGANCVQALVVREYDVNAALLREDVIASVTGNQAGYTQLSGSVTTGASCAYVVLGLHVSDSNAGASANGIVWCENTQLCLTSYATAYGASGMPYCELRFPQSPARLVVSGLLGDLPSSALLAFGTYLASWPAGSLLNFAIRRRGQESSTARLVGTSNGFYGVALSPTAVCGLDPTSYGGYYTQAVVTGAGWNPRAFSLTPADAPGVYHLVGRFLTQQILANLGNVTVAVAAQQKSGAWYGQTNGSDVLGSITGALSAPIAASNAWQVVDAGQFNVPALPAGAMSDPAQTYLTPRQQWGDSTGGGSTCRMGWQALVPIDGSLLVGVVNNPSNNPFAVTNQWLWSYFDGLGSPTNQPVGWTSSVESGPIPNPAHGGGPGTASSGAINVNSGADPSLTLDPTLELSGSGGVNELVGYLADGSAAVLPLYGELAYSPLYLYPR